MPRYTCEYCNNTFGRQSILHKHQRTAQYCLKIQNKDTVRPQCKHCNREFSREDNLARHEKICKVEPEIQTPPPIQLSMQEQQTNQLLEMIVQLQKTIANMSERPSNISNSRNMTMNLTPITDQEIQEHLENLTIDYIQEGAKGYANWANCYPFKDRLLCTDKARKKLRYKDNDGELVEDGGGVKLAKRFFQIIAPRNEEIINAEYRSLHKEVQKIAEEGTAYRADLTGLLTKASHLQELLIKCQQAARGEENELTKEFVNHLSKML